MESTDDVRLGGREGREEGGMKGEGEGEGEGRGGGRERRERE